MGIVKGPHSYNSVVHPHGEVREIFTGQDSSAANLAKAVIRDDRKHYHREATEIYYVLKGYGTILLDGKAHPLSPDSAVLIQPGVRHRAVASSYYHGALEILVFSSPPYNPADEFYD